jgi:hypothetical protein
MEQKPLPGRTTSLGRRREYSKGMPARPVQPVQPSSRSLACPLARHLMCPLIRRRSKLPRHRYPVIGDLRAVFRNSQLYSRDPVLFRQSPPLVDEWSSPRPPFPPLLWWPRTGTPYDPRTRCKTRKAKGGTKSKWELLVWPSTTRTRGGARDLTGERHN